MRCIGAGRAGGAMMLAFAAARMQTRANDPSRVALVYATSELIDGGSRIACAKTRANYRNAPQRAEVSASYERAKCVYAAM